MAIEGVYVNLLGIRSGKYIKQANLLVGRGSHYKCWYKSPNLDHQINPKETAKQIFNQKYSLK